LRGALVTRRGSGSGPGEAGWRRAPFRATGRQGGRAMAPVHV